MKKIYETPVAEIEIVAIEAILNSQSDDLGQSQEPQDPNQCEWDPQP